MKNLAYILVALSLVFVACGSPKNTVASADGTAKEEPVRIANDSLEYEIIIIDIGFNNYLNTIARPMGYFDENYLASRNYIYVVEWNNRVRNPARFNPNIYENVIDYRPNINYGMEVNYKLFNYFQFAQRKYNMRLGNFRVR